jgi:hypothetical protein
MAVTGTGVELRLADEPLDYPRPTPEQRAESRRIERGEMVEVRGWFFYETDDGPGRGSSHAARIDLTTDPTSALLELARNVREEDDSLGDLRGEGVSRFSFHAAPHRIELSDELRERVEAAGWRL